MVLAQEVRTINRVRQKARAQRQRPDGVGRHRSPRPAYGTVRQFLSEHKTEVEHGGKDSRKNAEEHSKREAGLRVGRGRRHGFLLTPPAGHRQEDQPHEHQPRSGHQRISLPGQQPVRVQNRQGKQRAKRGSDAKDDGVAQRHPYLVDTQAEEHRTNAPSESEQHHLDERGPGAVMVNIGQVWNRRRRQKPRRHDHCDHRVGQPDILPAPGGHALHGQNKAAIQDAAEQHPGHARNGNRAHG